MCVARSYVLIRLMQRCGNMLYFFLGVLIGYLVRTKEETMFLQKFISGKDQCNELGS